VTAFVPNPTEGFYLPALEGMAVGTLVVCPDCVGNRSFCLPGRNCFRPEHTVESISDAVRTALRLTPSQAREMLDNAKLTAAEHDLLRERQAFLRILASVDELW
jgi:glycosyltransferase involved in cell wall biosynthesis